MLNPRGVEYYHRLIDALVANGIKPMVTLYHWDLPQALEDEGGWLNESVVQHYQNFADLCFREYGVKVQNKNIPTNTSWAYNTIVVHVMIIKLKNLIGQNMDNFQ